jgi:hypothetical protein
MPSCAKFRLEKYRPMLHYQKRLVHLRAQLEVPYEETPLRQKYRATA